MNYFRTHPEKYLIERMGLYPINPMQCINCGKSLSGSEVSPTGKSTRSMCELCYQQLIINKVGDPSCLVCGNHLDRAELVMQMYNPREVSGHIHQGACLYNWVIRHCVCVGKADVIQFVYNLFPHPQPQISHQNHWHNMLNGTVTQQPALAVVDDQLAQMHDDILEAEYTEFNQQQCLAHEPSKALPPPEPRMTIEDLLQNFSNHQMQPASVRMYKGKPILKV